VKNYFFLKTNCTADDGRAEEEGVGRPLWLIFVV